MTRRTRRGAVSVEYILITALVAIALIVGWAYLETQAEMNQKAITGTFGTAAGVATYDASRAANVNSLLPTIYGPKYSGGDTFDNDSTFASRRVGGKAMSGYNFGHAGGRYSYDEVGIGTEHPYNYSTAPYAP